MKRPPIMLTTVCLMFVGMCGHSLFAQDNLDGLSRLAGMARMKTVINEERVRNGRTALQIDARLMRAAHNYAVVMARHSDRYVSHQHDIVKPSTTRIRQDEGIVGAYAENIHRWRSRNARGIVDLVVRDNSFGWMHYVTDGIRGHRANILKPTVTHMGVGVTRSTQDNKFYFCLLLGVSQRAIEAPREYPSSGGGVLAKPVIVENQSPGTLAYALRRAAIPDQGVLERSETFTLARGQRHLHICSPGATLRAITFRGRRVRGPENSVSVQLDKRHIAHFNYPGFGVRWTVR